MLRCWPRRTCRRDERVHGKVQLDPEIHHSSHVRVNSSPRSTGTLPQPEPHFSTSARSSLFETALRKSASFAAYYRD